MHDARAVVLGPPSVQQLANRDVTRQFRERAHVVVVQVRHQRVVQGGCPEGRQHARDVPGDPLAGRARCVGHDRHAARRADGRTTVAGVELQRRAVGQHEQGRVAATGVEDVDVEGARLPGRQWLTDRLRLGLTRREG